MEIFKIENLSFTYPLCREKAVDSISFSVNSGDFVTICGGTIKNNEASSGGAIHYQGSDCKGSLTIAGGEISGNIGHTQTGGVDAKATTFVMTGGKIDAFKTQTLLLMKAVRNIHHPKLKLIVFGSVTAELKEQVNSLADGETVQYIGWVEAKDSYSYFAAADLVVFPGRHSVFWEQVAAQGIPMLVKSWDGTHHVDLGGNVRFLYEDSVAEIQRELEELLENPDRLAEMKRVAVEKGMKTFSYHDISQRAIAR